MLEIVAIKRGRRAIRSLRSPTETYERIKKFFSCMTSLLGIELERDTADLRSCLEKMIGTVDEAWDRIMEPL